MKCLRGAQKLLQVCSIPLNKIGYLFYYPKITTNNIAVCTALIPLFVRDMPGQ